jgi:small-conductance mechanosensitive channel
MTWTNGIVIMAQTVDVETLDELEDAVAAEAISGSDVVVALLILAAGWVLGMIARKLIRWILGRVPNVPDYAVRLAGRTAQAVVVFIALAVALSQLGVDVAWLAIGVAVVLVVAVLMVRPLIENLAAGLLMSTRPSFSIGDQILTNEHEGDVIEINARSTVLQTRDWKRVHIPNLDVLDGPIVVFSAYERRRSGIELEIEYGADIEETSRLLVAAAAGVPGVLEEPAPVVRARGFGSGTYVLSLRWWHGGAGNADTVTRDGVVRSVKQTLDEAGISMPSPEIVVRTADDDGS